MGRWLSVFLALAGAPLFVTHAAAQPQNGNAQCIGRVELGERLKRIHGQVPVERGLITEGKAIVEWFASENGTWTLAITYPTMVSCIVAHGQFMDRPLGEAPPTVETLEP